MSNKMTNIKEKPLHNLHCSIFEIISVGKYVTPVVQHLSKYYKIKYILVVRGLFVSHLDISFIFIAFQSCYEVYLFIFTVKIVDKYWLFFFFCWILIIVIFFLYINYFCIWQCFRFCGQIIDWVIVLIYYYD